MNHFRDSRPGKFYRYDDQGEQQQPHPSETPAFLRFASKHGVALNLWKGDGASARDVVGGAGLDWPVIRRKMMIPAGEGLREATEVAHHDALVRPDTEQIMSVVTSAYTAAENGWVAAAVENYARPFHPTPSMIAAVGFGRAGERTLFAARIAGDEHHATCLVAHNTHGGEGAVRFQIVEVDRERQITCILGTPEAARTFPHTGDLQERLDIHSRPGTLGTFIERYLQETPPLWERLHNTLWTRRHTPALIQELWGPAPNPRIQSERIEAWDRVKARHPGHHLPDLMDGISDAASAYRAICDWIDNHSEGCERGDFTKDRDERLALGAGNKYKRDAWRWILDKA